MDSRSSLKLTRANTTKSSEKPAPHFYYKGNPVNIALSVSPLGLSRVEFDSNLLKVIVSSGLPVEHHKEFLHNQTLGWLKSQARKAFNEEVFTLSNRFNLEINKVSLKDTSSRWGSCSSKKNLNFNWRLIMAPEEILRYVVVHETAHLQELNHSDRFWQLVRLRCPDFEKHRLWLKKNGANLLKWRLEI